MTATEHNPAPIIRPASAGEPPAEPSAWVVHPWLNKIEAMSEIINGATAFGAGTLDPASLVQAEAILVGGAADENRLRCVLDSLPAAVYTTDAAGRVTYYNRAAVELAGREPVLGRDEWCVTWRLYQPDGTPLPHDRCPMAIAIRENRAVRGMEAILERPDGTHVPFLPYPTPLRDDTGALVGAVNMLVEISERKAAEKARAYLAAIVESSDDAIIGKDLRGVVTSWNRSAEVTFGYRAEEIIGRPIHVLFPPDRLFEEDLILERIGRGERIEHFETVRRRKDGREIDVSLTISPIRDDSARIIGVSKIARDITEQKRAERLVRDLNENLERRVAERTRELADANEQLRAESAERERAETALRQAQKMEAVGQLASGLAHDFNNLLTAILGNLEMIEGRLADENLRRMVQAALRSVLRGAQLNEQILAFSRKQHLAPRPVDLNVLIGDMSELLERTLGGTVRVSTALATKVWPAMVDPNQIEMVILNLAINARDALPEGGTVRIATRNVSVKMANEVAALAAGDYVCVTVSDDGTGMPAAVLERACEPFFTTKQPGKGSGLGLSQCYGIARQSGGDIKIDSAVGEGTTVEVYLPRCAAGIVPRPVAARSVTPAAESRSATILVVDDEADVREVAVAHLQELGYQVIQAAHGGAALRLIGDHAGIDLLIADYAMAEMNGIELAQAVRKRCPDLPIVIMTGYSDVSAIDPQLLDMPMLKKPYRIAELAATVERTLRQAAAERVVDGAGRVVALRRA